MNKTLIISILLAYKAVNDGTLSIVTDSNTYNNVTIDRININDVHIETPDCQWIEIDKIIGVYFADEKALVM